MRHGLDHRELFLRPARAYAFRNNRSTFNASSIAASCCRVLLLLPLSGREAAAGRLEPPEQVVDPLLLELQASKRELDARPGGGHLLHRGAQPPHLDQKGGQDVLP